MTELNQRHVSIKFDYKSDCKQIYFLDTCDRQNFLNAKSEHPHPLKKIFHTGKHFEFDEYAQHSKKTISRKEEKKSHSRKLIQQFVNKGCKKDVVTQQIQKVDQIDGKQLLHQQKRHDKQCIRLSATYSHSLPNLTDIITKHWHILQANQSSKETFSTLPIIAFRKATSLKQFIGTNTIHNNNKLIKTKINHHTGKCVPCN